MYEVSRINRVKSVLGPIFKRGEFWLCFISLLLQIGSHCPRFSSAVWKKKCAFQLLQKRQSLCFLSSKHHVRCIRPTTVESFSHSSQGPASPSSLELPWRPMRNAACLCNLFWSWIQCRFWNRHERNTGDGHALLANPGLCTCL